MKTKRTDATDCCSSEKKKNNSSGIRVVSMFSAAFAAGLAGAGCLGCIPFIGAAVASSSLAALLDEHLKWLQVILLGISAILSAAHFRRKQWPVLPVMTAGFTYIALFVNALTIQSRLFGMASVLILVFVHVWKRQTSVERSGLSLLFFKGCPNVAILKSILKEEKISSFEEVDLETLPEGDPLRSYSSPTLLHNGHIVVGARTTNATLSCSFFSKEEMRTSLLKSYGKNKSLHSQSSD